MQKLFHLYCIPGKCLMTSTFGDYRQFFFHRRDIYKLRFKGPFLNFLFISFRRRALYKDIKKYSNFKTRIFVGFFFLIYLYAL